MRETLFDDVERNDPEPARHVEARFSFLNRVEQPYFAVVRELMEEWFSHVPFQHQADLRSRFRSREDRQALGAFWELYLHEAFLRQSMEVLIHPPLEHTTRVVDFLVNGGAADAFFVEATVVAASDAETANDRRLDVIYNTLDGTDSPNFLLWIQVAQPGSASPAGAQLRTKLEVWLASLNPDEEARRGENLDQLPKYEWEGHGWRLRFTAIPKKPDRRGVGGIRPLAVFSPAAAQAVDPVTPIRSQIGDKAKAYGTLPRPYVIAALVDLTFFHDEDLDAALLGSFAARFDPNSKAVEEFRQPDGLWTSPAGPHNTGVSAVLASSGLRPWTVARTEPKLWVNPWAAKELEADLVWASLRPNHETNRLEEVRAGIQSHTLLGIAQDWPPGDPFPV